MGILENVDDSIFKLNDILDHGFEIKSCSINDYMGIFPESSFISSFDLFLKNCYGKDLKVSYFHNSFLGEIYYSSAHKQFLVDMSSVSKFDEYDHNYLEPTLRKIRLFKEGNIHMPFKFYYFEKNSNSFLGGKWGSITHDFSREIFKIEDSEIEELKVF